MSLLAGFETDTMTPPPGRQSDFLSEEGLKHGKGRPHRPFLNYAWTVPIYLCLGSLEEAQERMRIHALFWMGSKPTAAASPPMPSTSVYW
jgi:hypothetical protein